VCSGPSDCTRVHPSHANGFLSDRIDAHDTPHAKASPPLPEQHARTDTYRGIELLVIVQRQPTGRWVWSYLAGDMQGRLRGAQLPTAEAALTQGMNAARARVG
jgi:hypothetical protein